MMELSNVKVWLFLRRQESVKVRRFMCLVLSLAVVVGLSRFSSDYVQMNSSNGLGMSSSTSTSSTHAKRQQQQTEKIFETEPFRTKRMNSDNTTTSTNHLPFNDVVEKNDRDTQSMLTSMKTKSETPSKKNQPIHEDSSWSSSSSQKNTFSQEGKFQPKLAWLMSWPNSGTSFTMNGVEKLSNKSIATNYGDEVTASDSHSLPLYPRRLEGPYWKGNIERKKFGFVVDLPETYILTKTHCGSRCSSCGPTTYLETPTSFLRACASGHGRFPPRRKRYLVHYPPQECVARAIQLIRNPFHNVVARFHLDRRNKSYKPEKYSEWVEAHPDNEHGFRKWCEDMNRDFAVEEEEMFHNATNDLWQLLRPIPCRAEFFMYIQWHNLVHESLALLRQNSSLTDGFPHIPLLTIYYEDYRKDVNGTFGKILDFLELDAVGALPVFSPRDDSYQGYYTNEERKQIQVFLQHAASDVTWKQIQHYFT